MARTLQRKALENTRLANNYGGWIYCEGCNKTIGYLCYVTYDLFSFHYTCQCGSSGSVCLMFMDECKVAIASQPMVMVKNRLCCPVDESPLVTILVKKLAVYQCEIVCKSCHIKYQEASKNGL